MVGMVQGETLLSISAMIKNDVALFSFVATPEDAMSVRNLKLPEDCRLIIVYRGDKFILADEETELEKGDEAVVLCHSERMHQLRSRWTHVDLGSDELNGSALE